MTEAAPATRHLLAPSSSSTCCVSYSAASRALHVELKQLSVRGEGRSSSCGGGDDGSGVVMYKMCFCDEDSSRVKCTLTSSSATGVSLVVTSPKLLQALLEDALTRGDVNDVNDVTTATASGEQEQEKKEEEDEEKELRGGSERGDAGSEAAASAAEADRATTAGGDDGETFTRARSLSALLRRLLRHAKVIDGEALPPAHFPAERVFLQRVGNPPASAWALAPMPSPSSSSSAVAAVPRLVPHPVMPPQLRDDPRFCAIRSMRDARRAAAGGALFFVFEGPPSRLDYINVSSPTDVRLIRVAVAAHASASSSRRLVLVNLSAGERGGKEGDKEDTDVEDLEGLLKNSWLRLFTFPALSRDLEPVLHRAACERVRGDGRRRQEQTTTTTERRRPPPSIAGTHPTSAVVPSAAPPVLPRQSGSVPISISRDMLPALAEAYLLARVPHLGLMSRFVAAAATTASHDRDDTGDVEMRPSSAAYGCFSLETWIQGGLGCGAPSASMTLEATAETTETDAPPGPNASPSSPSPSSSVVSVDVYVTATATKATTHTRAGQSSQPSSPFPTTDPGAGSSSSLSRRVLLLRAAPVRVQKQGGDHEDDDNDRGSPDNVSRSVFLLDEKDRQKLLVVMAILKYASRLLLATPEHMGDDNGDPVASALVDNFCRRYIKEEEEARSNAQAQAQREERIELWMNMKDGTMPMWDIGGSYLVPPTATIDEIMLRALPIDST